METSARRSHAILCVPEKKTRAAPFSPNREDGRALKSYSLFTSVVGSKMSNLSHHNNSLPPTDPLALHAHTSAADKMFRLPDSGTPQITTTHTKGGRLFTSRLNDDDLQIWSATTFMFSGHPVAVYDPPRQKKPPSIHLDTQKARLTTKRFPDRNAYRSHTAAAILFILFSLTSCYIPRKKTPYSGFVFVTK